MPLWSWGRKVSSLSTWLCPAHTFTSRDKRGQYTICWWIFRNWSFRQLKAANGHKAIVGKEEQILGSLREKSRIDMERMIQLLDGSTWVYTKGDQKCTPSHWQSSRIIEWVQSTKSILPNLCETDQERRDGTVDRMLIYQPLPHRLAARETEGSTEDLMGPLWRISRIFKGHQVFV